MYTLIKSTPIRRLVVEEVPAIGIALFIAEMFYKFHSFLLETMAFLATWFIASWIASNVNNVISHIGRRKVSLTQNMEE